ncbi:twin-arginine translocase subunit TatC [Bacillaceae bacterium]
MKEKSLKEIHKESHETEIRKRNESHETERTIAMDEKEMPLIEHIAELRKRIIWVLVVFSLAMILGFFAAGPLVEYLKSDPAGNLPPLNAFGPSDALRVYVQVAFILAAVLTFPFFLYQLWRFVSPGLRPDERRIALSFIPMAAGLFVLGILFAYYVVFPLLIAFMSDIAERMGVNEVYGISEYFRFMFNIVLPVGILFELPIVVMFLTRLRILNPMRLARIRKVAYFVLVIVATLITPPEIITDILVLIPLLLLYEFSVWLSRIVYRKQLREEAELAARYGEAGE